MAGRDDVITVSGNGVDIGKEDAGVVGVDAKEDKGDGSSVSLWGSALMADCRFITLR